MEPSVVIQLTGTFVKFVGETVAEVKRLEVAAVDKDLLRLKQKVLSERLEDLEKQMVDAVDVAKKNMAGNLASRGMANSSTMPSFILGIENDAREQLGIAWREHNRAIEEFALLERRISELSCPCWKRAWRWLRRPAP
jgi:hypothetical protein